MAGNWNSGGRNPVVPKPRGRQLGSKNRIGENVKKDILAVFENLGSVHAMTDWARKNKTDFYTKIWARLIPTTVTATVDMRNASEFTDDELAAIIVGAASGQRAAIEATGPEVIDSVH